MRLIQFETMRRERRVGIVDDGGGAVRALVAAASMRELALLAIAAGRTLEQQAVGMAGSERFDYPQLLAELRVLTPLDHEDPAHVLISGTGLTHFGSAASRDQVHRKAQEDEAHMSDSMRVFKWGVEGGRPKPDQAGVQPEWYYKGDGAIAVRPGAPLPTPGFGDDAGEEAEIVGLYLVGADRKPYRLGFALGNEFCDHVMERKNYHYIAHSKLRFCSFGPELRTGDLPQHLSGMSRIRRQGRVIWEKEFLTGEANMCHSIDNLEFHHFKYVQFLRPGDIHIHFFGTATLSFADGVQTRQGDEFEIDAVEFGMPLINTVGPAASLAQPAGVLQL
jgi:hypothetical protein